MFKCEDCGDIEFTTIDGHRFSDRLLEGVTFEIRESPSPTKQIKYTIKVIDEDKDYFEQFNEKMWLENASEYVHGIDLVTCPKCRGDVIINEN